MSDRKQYTVDEYGSLGACVIAERDDLRAENERLKDELAQWQKWGMSEIAIRNPNVASYMEHWEERATRAEAALEVIVILANR